MAETIQVAWLGHSTFLPIGDHFTMSPQEAAEACQLLQVPKVVPMHHGTFPLLKGKPSHLKELLAGSSTKMLEFQLGETKEI